MIWRDHKRLAARMAEAFGLDREALIEGSIEPDRKRTLTHTWPRARRTARAALYRARAAFLRGNRRRAARFVGIVSHYIADGMVHETIDTFHRSKEHSQIENELGGMVEISSLAAADPAEEGLADGEFVFGEIDALVREGLDRERLGRALSLLGSAVISPPAAPEELLATRRDFIARINRPAIRISGAAAGVAGAAAAAIFRDPVFLLPLPFLLLGAGKPSFFRCLARYGWILAGGASLALIDNWFYPPYLLLTLLLAGLSIQLAAVSDLSRRSEKWFRIPRTPGG